MGKNFVCHVYFAVIIILFIYVIHQVSAFQTYRKYGSWLKGMHGSLILMNFYKNVVDFNACCIFAYIREGNFSVLYIQNVRSFISHIIVFDFLVYSILKVAWN